MRISTAMIILMCLAWCFVQGQVIMEPNKAYSGTVGGPNFYRFYTNSTNGPDLYSVSLSPDSNQSLQLLIQDMGSRIFSTLTAPYTLNDEIISRKAKKIICQSKVTDFYDFFPAGKPGATYTIKIKPITGRLLKEKEVNASYYPNPADLVWFFFDHHVDENNRPLEISVKSNDGSKSRLIALQTECPTLFTQIEEMAPNRRAFLFWSRQARMTLSYSRKPYLEPGRWFIGVQSQNFSAQKNFTISLKYGPSPHEYWFPMLIPPLIMGAIILVILISSLSIMSLITRRIGSKVEPPTNSWGYFLLTTTVGIVFLVPGFQVITEELSKMESSGNRDLCYYNEFCTRPYGEFMALNNVYSNIGYLVAGFGFIIYAWMVRFYSKRSRINVGMPRDGSIPYAMGVAIMIEGVASGLYHLCPSRVIFQFDSANMFVIISLGLAELYRRAIHPPSKPALFFWIMIVLFCNYIGTTAEGGQTENFISLTVWSFFGVLVVFFVVFLFPFMHKEPHQKYFGFWKRLSWKTLPKGRFALWCILFLGNSALLIGNTYIMKPKAEFSQTFLGMLTLSQVISLVTYEISNLKHFTKTPKLFLTAKLVLILSFVATWSAAIWYFLSKTSNKASSPEESRDQNTECVVANFYDAHDMWHFLSALSLLFMCLIFFHLDLNAQWNGIGIGERTIGSDFWKDPNDDEETEPEYWNDPLDSEDRDGILKLLVNNEPHSDSVS